jgi:N-acetyl-gamma-glutamyl-phosphate reductase
MTDTPKIRVGIIGAAGLSAGRLIDILLTHPHAEIVSCVSESSPGKPIHSVHPQLRGRSDLTFDGMDHGRLAECDVVFSCKKAGDSFAYVADVLAGRARLIDLSGDYRLGDSALYPHWYGLEHKFPDLVKSKRAVYGLPEFYREEIKTARLLANPGCYTTTSILACAPFVANGLGLDSPIIINAISGVSGAGRNAKAENLFISVSENIRAYRIGNHQHTPEIEQELSAVAGASAGADGSAEVTVLFVPHVGPFKAGIMTDCYINVPEGVTMPSTEDACKMVAECYHGEPFVRVYEPGQLPQVDFVAGSNFCDIGVVADERTRTIVAVSVTDNLVKGAAGQAVQNMNIMFGFAETAGLL